MPVDGGEIEEIFRRGEKIEIEKIMRKKESMEGEVNIEISGKSEDSEAKEQGTKLREEGG